MVGSAAGNGLTDQVPGQIVAVFLQVGLIGSHTDGLFMGQLLVHLVQQHFAGVFLTQAGQCLKPLHLLGADGVHLGQMGFGFFLLFLELFFAFFQRLGLAVEGGLFLVDAVLLPGDLSAALLDLLVGFGLLGVHFRFQAEGFVLGLQNGFFAFLVCGLDRFVHQPGCLGFGAADLSLSGLFTVVVTNKITPADASSNCDDHDHDPSDRGHCVHSPQS